MFTGTDVTDGSGLVNSTIPAELRAVERSHVQLEDHSFVAANAVVLPGVTVGEGAVIGAGAVALDDVEPWTINVGQPCRAVKERPRERLLALGERLLHAIG